MNQEQEVGIKLVRITAFVMMAAGESRTKTPEGLREYVKKHLGQDYSIKFISGALRFLWHRDLMLVHHGENRWEMTDSGSDALLRHLQEMPSQNALYRPVQVRSY